MIILEWTSLDRIGWVGVLGIGVVVTIIVVGLAVRR